MPATLSADVKPATKTTDKTNISQDLFARLRYTREVPTAEDAAGAPATIQIAGSYRAELAIDGTAKIEVNDYLPKAPFSLQIETTQGTILWQSADQKSSDDDKPHIFEVPDSVFDTKLNPPRAAPSLLRSGRFVRLDDLLPDFARFRLFGAAIRRASINGAVNPQIEAVRHVLGLAGQGEVASFEVKRVEPAKLNPAFLSALRLQPVLIRPDGAFNLSIDIQGDELAWLWLLLGPEDFAGYQLDPLPAQPHPPVIIMLPVAATETTRSGEGDGGTPTTGNGGSDGDNGSPPRPPLDFDEGQLIEGYSRIWWVRREVAYPR